MIQQLRSMAAPPEQLKSQHQYCGSQLSVTTVSEALVPCFDIFSNFS